MDRRSFLRTRLLIGAMAAGSLALESVHAAALKAIMLSHDYGNIVIRGYGWKNENQVQTFAGYLIERGSQSLVLTPVRGTFDWKLQDEDALTELIRLGRPIIVPGGERDEARSSMQPLAVPANASGVALALTADGATVAGYYDNGPFTPYHAFRWTAATDVVDLGTLDPANNTSRSSFATALSGDGAVCVGYSETAGGATQHAFRWTQTSGMVDLGSAVGAAGYSRAYAVTPDGSVIVGESDQPGSFGNAKQAFRWTSGGGFQNLGALQPDFASVANAITANGAVIVGMSGVSVTVGNTTTGGSRAFRWTAAGGMQNLGVLPGHQYSAATAVSADGAIVVGLSSNGPIDRNSPGGDYRYANVPASSRAFYWTAEAGMKDLNQLLADAGVSEAGVTLVAARSVSPAGTWIAADAVTPETEPNTTTLAMASLTSTAASSRLVNLSTRGPVQTGDNVLIPGFVLGGTASKRLLIRAVGPTLGHAPFNVPGALADPHFVLKRLNTSTNPPRYDDVASNDNWADNANAAAITQTAQTVGAFAFEDSREAALLMDLAPGQYTVVAAGVGNTTGVGIVELYDADAASVDARLINLSTRGFCGTGDQVMIPGFVISGQGARTLLLRVVGPGLQSTFGLTGAMADPKLALHRHSNGADTVLSTQDDWGDATDAASTAAVAQQVGAFPLASGSKDAAFVVTLQPGVYTVVGSSASAGGTGMVLVEIYVVP